MIAPLQKSQARVKPNKMEELPELMLKAQKISGEVCSIGPSPNPKQPPTVRRATLSPRTIDRSIVTKSDQENVVVARKASRARVEIGRVLPPRPSVKVSQDDNRATVEPNGRVITTCKSTEVAKKTKVVVSAPKRPPRVYSYKYYPGNNGRVILNAFRRRPWWRSAGKSDASKAKLIEKMQAAETNARSGPRRGSSTKGGKAGDSSGSGVPPSTSSSTSSSMTTELHPKEMRDEAEETIEYDFVWEMYRNPKRYKDRRWSSVVLNHLEHNSCLVSKKGLYKCLKAFCSDTDASGGLDLAKVVPRTFYLPVFESMEDEQSASEDTEGDFRKWLDYNREKMAELATDGDAAAGAAKQPSPSGYDARKGVVWIVKPASYANRGFGIKVVQGEAEVRGLLRTKAVRKDIKKGVLTQNTAVETVDAAVEAAAAAIAGTTLAAEDGTDSRKGDEELSPEERDVGTPDSEASRPGSTASAMLSKAARQLAVKNGWICQEYMLNPLLVSGRKFDIRVFVVIQHERKGDKFRGFFFRDGYVRTSCKKYSLSTLSDRECHLTNDAVQKKAKGYGKLENGNKLSWDDWQESINRDYPGAPADIVRASIIPKIKHLTSISLEAAARCVGETQISRTFEVLGYDYMVDSNFEPTLIEVNSNPCLEFACPMLEEIITNLFNNVFRQCLDTIFPPPSAANRTTASAEAVASIEAEESMLEQVYPRS